MSAAAPWAMAHRAQRFGIIPGFSFMLGNPRDPVGDALATMALIYELKEIDPRCEIILYHFTPTPQRRGSYGGVDAQNPYPVTLEEWATPRWVRASPGREARCWSPTFIRLATSSAGTAPIWSGKKADWPNSAFATISISTRPILPRSARPGCASTISVSRVSTLPCGTSSSGRVPEKRSMHSRTAVRQC